MYSLWDIKGKKIGYIAVTYRYPSETASEFDTFLENFKKLLYQIQLFRSSFVRSNEDLQIDSLATTYGLEQLISDLTHIWPNSSTCTELIFTDQPNLVVDIGLHPSLHTNYHHQIT